MQEVDISSFMFKVCSAFNISSIARCAHRVSAADRVLAFHSRLVLTFAGCSMQECSSTLSSSVYMFRVLCCWISGELLMLLIMKDGDAIGWFGRNEKPVSSPWSRVERCEIITESEYLFL